MIKGAQAYFTTQVTTTKQSDILLMLYDGAIKFLNQAKVKIEERDYAQKGILISKAMDILGELDGSLNAEKGGEVAKNLHQLYFYCNTRLLRANMDLNTELVDEVIRILSSLREAFEIIKDSAPAPEPPSPQAPQMRPAPGTSAGTQGPPKVSAARASKVYGGLSIPQPEADDASRDAAQNDAAPEAESAPQNNAADQTSPADEAAPRPGPSLVPPKGPTLLRKPGLPGAYGRQNPTR